MILVDLTHTFPVSVGDAFAYITDTGNWKAFLPNFVRLHDPTQVKWDTPVDKVTVVIRLLSRDVQVSMMLEEYGQDSRVPYVSRQKGRTRQRVFTQPRSEGAIGDRAVLPNWRLTRYRFSFQEVIQAEEK